MKRGKKSTLQASARPQHPNLANTTPEYALRKRRRAAKRSSTHLAALMLAGCPTVTPKARYSLEPLELAEAA